LNAVIVDALDQAIAREEGNDRSEGSLQQQVQQVRRALGEAVVEVDVKQFPSQLRPPLDLPDTETLRQAMPQLAPPMSATIIADRADRI
jgi:hypothetical protein